MAKYRKIDPRIWNDKKFRSLSDDGQLAFLFLLTHPHMTSLGAMRATLPGLAAEKRWSEKRFREAFQEVSAKGMAKHDEEASMVWLPKFIRYNGPESPNVLKAWVDALDLLPECTLKDEVIHSVKVFTKGLTEAFKKALPEVFAKAMANPEQEQEPEQKQEQDMFPGGTSPAPDEFEERFQEFRSLYPKRSGDHRWQTARNHIRARLREGHTWDDILDGTRRYAAFVRTKGDEGTPHTKQAASFVGTDRCFLEPWNPPPTKAETRLAGNMAAVEEARERIFAGGSR